MSILEVRGIEKTYSGKRILKAVSFDLESGKLTVLGGLNGIGKSTLIKMMSGDIRPDSGEIVFDGHHVELRSIVEARRIGLSAVYQEYMLVPDLTVAENIFLGSGKFTISRKKMNSEASRLLSKFGLSFDPSSKVSSLSSDEQALLEFAAAVFSEPKVLMIDDLFSVLQTESRKRLLQMIEVIKNKGTAVLVVTTDPDLMLMADHLLFMDESGVEYLPCPIERGALLERMGASSDFSILPAEGELLIEISNLAGSGQDLSLKRGEVLNIFCESGELVRAFTRAMIRQDPFTDNSVPLFREAKSFFDRFSSRSSSTPAEKYFCSNLKNTGLVSQVMLKKSGSFKSSKSLKKSFILNKESVVSVKSFLAGLERIPGFSGLVSEEDKKLSQLRFDACDLYVFVRPLLGLDPVSVNALSTVLQEIVNRSKAAVIISDEAGSSMLSTRKMRSSE